MRMPVLVNTENSRTASHASQGGVTPQDLGACITASYNNGQICADIPLLGKHCLTFSGLPSGNGSAKVCANYKFPASVEVCAYIGSQKIGCLTL